MSTQPLGNDRQSTRGSESLSRTHANAGPLRRLARGLAVAAIAALTASAALAQEFPSRSIRLIVPFTPGAGTDTTARILAEKLSVSLGQPVVVENRGGASGSIGTDAGAKAAADGYTWTYATDPPFTINPHLRKLSFDPLKDFVPVSLVAKVPLVLVANPALAASTIAELVALAKQTPGKLKVIAVAARDRVPSLREVPTVAEAGYQDFEIGAFHGLVMPAGTPRAIVRKVNDAVTKALQQPDVAARFEALGFVTVGGAPELLDQLLRSDSDRWAKLIRAAHIQAD